jgi:hypothetical protein
MLNLVVNILITTLYRVKGKNDSKNRKNLYYVFLSFFLSFLILPQFKVVYPLLSEQDLEIRPLRLPLI